MGNSFTYMIHEGVRNVFKNKKGTTVSLVTMILSMFLFGAFFAIGENVNSILEQVQRKQGIEVFIENEATDEQVSELEEKIKALEGINMVTFKSKQEALDYVKEQLKDHQELLEGYQGENNIFSASFIVTLTDLSLATHIESQIGEMENVKKITSNNETLITLMNFSRFINIAIGVISVLLLLISTTIISNTIKITVYSRRKEISIMKYVGATNRFIRWPFIIEGILIGLVSASVTLLIVATIYNAITQAIQDLDGFKRIGVNLLQFYDIVKSIGLAYLVLGIGIGMIGSSISMKKYLEV